MPVEIATNIYQFQLIGAKITVLLSGDNVLVIDTGTRGSLNRIKTAFSSLGIDRNQVSLIVLTHHHPDHSGGVSELSKYTDAPIAAHRLDAGIIQGIQDKPDVHTNLWLAAITRPFLSLLYSDNSKIDFYLEDRQELPFEEKVEVIHVPGHTPGSICLFVPKQKVMIVGDALEFRSGKLLHASKSFTADIPKAADSLKKLLDYDFETLCFSHFEPLTENAYGQLELLLDNL